MTSPKHREDAHQAAPSPARRRFLGLVLGGLAAAATGSCAAARPRGAAGSVAAAGRASAVAAGPASPVVVRVADRRVLNGASVNPDVAANMLDAAMSALTGEKEPTAAWSSLFSRDDVVAIKVNCLAAPRASTHPQLVTAIVSSLRSAGVRAENIIIYDRLNSDLEHGGFTINTGRGVRCFGSDVSGYDAEPTEAGTVGSCLTRIVSEMCTAIINVPVVKDHDLAGVTIALKNHFGSIHNPNKLHVDRCCPAAADLNLFPALRRKQRLIIADALMVTYDGGPAYNPRPPAPEASILVARDPVALDAVGLDMIDTLRRRNGLPTLAEQGRHPGYIAVAADAQHGLGVADLKRIQRIAIDLAQGSRA